MVCGQQRKFLGFKANGGTSCLTFFLRLCKQLIGATLHGAHALMTHIELYLVHVRVHLRNKQHIQGEVMV
jgi:hypothetical protein